MHAAERQRDRQTGTDRETDRQAGRQADRDRQTDRPAGKQVNRQAEVGMQTETGKILVRPSVSGEPHQRK